MDFRRLFIVDSVAIAGSGATAVAGAMTGLGVWSLVAQSLTLTMITAGMLWRFSAWRPARTVDPAALRDLFGYSASLLGFNVLNHSNRHLDSLLIGKIIGSTALGIHSRAYDLMLLPISQVANTLTRVMFPALAVVQYDVATVKRVHLRATRAIALITFPMMIGLLVVAEPFIVAVYGEPWAGVIPIVRILRLTGMEQSVSATVGWIINSQGRTDVQLRWGGYTFVARSIAFVLGVRWGILGVAVAYVISDYVLFYPAWAIPGRLIGMRVGEMVVNLARPFGCAAAMGVAVWALGLCLPPSWPHWLELAVEVSAGALVYAGLIHALGIPAYLEVRQLLGERVC